CTPARRGAWAPSGRRRRLRARRRREPVPCDRLPWRRRARGRAGRRGPTRGGARGRRLPRGSCSPRRPRRSDRTAPGRGGRGRRSPCPRALFEVAEEEVRVEGRQVEAPRGLVDELDAVGPGVVLELIVDPLDRLLDRRFACRHRGPPFATCCRWSPAQTSSSTPCC